MAIAMEKKIPPIMDKKCLKLWPCLGWYSLNEAQLNP
jgi:hypothetical protein